MNRSDERRGIHQHLEGIQRAIPIDLSFLVLIHKRTHTEEHSESSSYRSSSKVIYPESLILQRPQFYRTNLEQMKANGVFEKTSIVIMSDTGNRVR